jgi:hypothetical protein
MSSSLSPPPEGYMYQVWLQRSGRPEQVATVEIYPNNVGLAIVPLMGGESVSGMAVTMEPLRLPSPQTPLTILAAATNTPEPMR